VWQGDLKSGKGTLSHRQRRTEANGPIRSTRALKVALAPTRKSFSPPPHAGCFTMALSAQLGGAGMTAQKLETTAKPSHWKKMAKAFPSPRAISIWSPPFPAQTKRNSMPP